MNKSIRQIELDRQATRLNLCSEVMLQWVTQLQLTQSSAAQAVCQMLQAFSVIEMQDSSCDNPACRIDPAQKDLMYQGFQYQDRLNQMLELVVRDVQRLHAVINGQDEGEEADTMDANAWRARLQSEFVMAEQMGKAAADAYAAGNDATFF